MENFKFVFTHSAYLLPFGLTFLLLGFLFGYFHWARRPREDRGSSSRAENLELGQSKTVPEPTPTEQIMQATTPKSTPDLKAKEASSEVPFLFKDISFNDAPKPE